MFYLRIFTVAPLTKNYKIVLLAFYYSDWGLTLGSFLKSIEGVPIYSVHFLAAFLNYLLQFIISEMFLIHFLFSNERHGTIIFVYKSNC